MKGFGKVGILALLVIAVIALLFIFGFLAPRPESTNENAAVDEAVRSYVELYLGLINVTVMNESLSNGVWMLTVSAKSLDRMVFMDMRMYDSNKSIFKIYESLTLPEKPATIIDIPGKIGCSVGEKITVDIYIDPYDPWTQKYDSLIEGYIAKFGQLIRPNYRLVPTISYEAFKEVNNDAIYAFRYMACAKEETGFSALKKCIYEENANKSRNLNESEVKDCVSKAGLDVNKTEACTQEEAIRLLSTDQTFADSYLTQPTTPSIVIDCKYKTFPLFIDRVMCYLYPKMTGC